MQFVYVFSTKPDMLFAMWQWLAKTIHKAEKSIMMKDH